MSDMRKWINLVEDTEGQWYSNEEIETLFKPERNRGLKGPMTKWINQLLGMPQNILLYKAQNVFQKWVLPDLQPIWISDIHFPDMDLKLATYHLWFESIMWRIERGEDDPDE